MYIYVYILNELEERSLSMEIAASIDCYIYNIQRTFSVL